MIFVDVVVYTMYDIHVYYIYGVVFVICVLIWGPLISFQKKKIISKGFHKTVIMGDADEQEVPEGPVENAWALKVSDQWLNYIEWCLADREAKLKTAKNVDFPGAWIHRGR